MDILLAAVLGELTSRCINFFITNSSKPSALYVEDRLCRILLRAQVIVDEAMGRQITNQAMLQQLDMLREGIYRGYYILDTFRYQSHNKEDAKGQVLSNSLFVSKVIPLQGLCSSSRNKQILVEMQKSFDHLSSMIRDVQDLVVFLMSYPRIYHQPYSMHLILNNCMFGRQMETELVIDFLLHTRPHASEKLEVLPIIGPSKVGKSTLVAHVCKDERVRDHFTQILFLRDHDFTGYDVAISREVCQIEHQSLESNSNRDGRRSLVVVELVGDLNEDAWNGFYSASMHHVPSGSKVIVTSKSDNITKFGTRQALRMKFLSHEAYWYFFKTLTFGSIDPKMHPRFAHVAMEIAKILSRCFISAKMTACLLTENFDIHLWYKVLDFLRNLIQTNVSRYGGVPFDLLNQKRPTYIGRMAAPSECAMLYDEHKCALREEVPRIIVQDIMYGRVKAHGKFKVLGWRSQIPPYHSYILTCEIGELKTRAQKRKRCMKN